jgi:uncharacterized protein (TIGR03790 family)
VKTQCLLFLPLAMAQAQTAKNVVVIRNDASALSGRIAAYYIKSRSIPLANLCAIRTSTEETILRPAYEREIEAGVGDCLRKAGLEEQALFLVTTRGVPLRIGDPGQGPDAPGASVDSELTLLYRRLKGRRIPAKGAVTNPYFGERGAFGHPRHDIYLVTRLAAYDFAGVQAMVDRSLAARDRGKVVLDLNADNDDNGNNWLRRAARLLPAERVYLETTSSVVYDQSDVIGFASWGSNDKNRKSRTTRFKWLPGAIMTEYVSTNGRSFEKPPDTWTITTWKDSTHWFKGSPQTMTADYILEGVTGASGHVDEPYLHLTPRPDYLFPAYLGGRTLAESYYSAIPGLSWQNIVVGDPLCRLRR